MTESSQKQFEIWRKQGRNAGEIWAVKNFLTGAGEDLEMPPPRKTADDKYEELKDVVKPPSVSNLDAWKIKTAPRMSELETRKPACGCACHEGKLYKLSGYLHDTECCAEMNGTLNERSKPSESPEWEKEFSERYGYLSKPLDWTNGVIDSRVFEEIKAFIASIERKAKEEGIQSAHENDGREPNALLEARAEERASLAMEIEKEATWLSYKSANQQLLTIEGLKAIIARLTNPEE